MNDSPAADLGDPNKRAALVMEFIAEVSRGLEGLRAGDGDLGALDPVSWRRLQHTAHSIGVRAGGLQLGVLQRCARELEQLATEVIRRTDADRAESVQGAMVALEILDLELHVLKRNSVLKPP